MSVQNTPEPTAEQKQIIRKKILEVLGESKFPEHQMAYELYKLGDYQGVKRLCAGYLEDKYIQCLGHLIETYKLNSSFYVSIANAARTVANYSADCMYELNTRFPDDENYNHSHERGMEVAAQERSHLLSSLGALIRRTTE